MIRAASMLCCALGLAACASEEPPPPPSFDSSVGLVVVEVHADGFVRCDDRRIPFDALVLELRQRTRGMASADLQKFVVEVRGATTTDEAAGVRVQQAMNELVDALFVMGVRQVNYR